MGRPNAEISSLTEPIDRDMEKLVHSSQESATIDVPEISEHDLKSATRLTNALASLRDAERELSDASRSALNLSEQDMRALQFLVASLRRGQVVTPSMLATYLNISPASTTKLLNRLEASHHISRMIHPSDRRAFKIEVNPESEAMLQRSVGRQQARRLLAALQLSEQNRAAVIDFLEEVTEGIRNDREQWRGSSIVEPEPNPLAVAEVTN